MTGSAFSERVRLQCGTTPDWSNPLVIPQEQNSHLDINLQYGGKDGILEWLRVGIWRNIKVSYLNDESSYEISWGDPNLAEITKPYNLSQVMSTYGRPSKILMFTRQATLLNQPWPISLVVFYPEHGFMIEYVADDRPVIKNPGVTWCPYLAFPYFWFWSPSQDITMKDVVSWIDGYQISHNWVVSGRFKTLEDATGMSVNELYSLFTSDQNACITTPAELWPMPGE